MATKRVPKPRKAAPQSSPQPAPTPSPNWGEQSFSDIRNDLAKRVYEVNAMLACIRARLDPFLECADDYVGAALMDTDVMVRVAGAHVSNLGEAIEQAITDCEHVITRGRAIVAKGA